MAVYLHGGGWTVGSLDGIDPVCRALANRSGCAIVSVDYRLAPEHKFPAPLHDCLDSVEYLARHSAELGLDASRIALIGDSAGGNLAASAAIAGRTGALPRIAGLVLAYPAVEYGVVRPSWTDYADGPLITTADVEWFWRNYFRDDRDQADPLAVPAAATSPPSTRCGTEPKHLPAACAKAAGKPQSSVTKAYSTVSSRRSAHSPRQCPKQHTSSNRF
ncbi:alpha/beta hydrolase fold [Amycolatopsis saalfeldensis]|uniref:Alpha/beta hydrolase fold n=1 Tax=Amycolatopsis saalfeldensis TaxID=394193 RepID=A0A1H8XYA2_9PSEU|nr:alpha/beta hydrolase fold [Amycolatopsis saalfeldensis]